MDDKFKGLEENEWFSGDEEVEYWLNTTENSSGAERREDERKSVSIRVRVEPGGLPALASDISLGGLLVNTDSPLTQGRDVTIFISMGNQVAEARGVVAWMSRGSSHESNQAKLCMGVRFTWLSLSMAGLLAQR